jgi:hypothetical protein
MTNAIRNDAGIGCRVCRRLRDDFIGYDAADGRRAGDRRLTIIDQKQYRPRGLGLYRRGRECPFTAASDQLKTAHLA